MSSMKRSNSIFQDGWYSEINEYVIACDWALENKNIIAADITGNIYSFDAKTGKLLYMQKDTHNKSLLDLSVNPNGSIYATCGQNGKVDINAASDGSLLSSNSLGNDWVDNIQWTNNGKLLAGSIGKFVHVIDSSGNQLWRSDELTSTVSAIYWSNNSELAIASYGQVIIYDVKTNKVCQRFEWKGSLISLALSPNGEIVACGSQDNSVHFWRRTNGKDAEMTGYPGKPKDIVFDITGQYLATGGSPQVTVWNFKDKGPEGTIPGQLILHNEPISCLSFANSSSLLASGAKDGSIAIWKLDKNGDGEPIDKVSINSTPTRLKWKRDDNAFLAASDSGKLFCWDIPSKKGEGIGFKN